MIHFSNYRPKLIPYLGTVDPTSLARVQSIDPTVSLNREKIEELGRDGAVGYKKGIPNVTVRMTQYEHGNMEIYKLLANKPLSTQTLTLSDFRISMVDLLAYLQKDDGSMLGTVWYPKVRISGFGINIGSPDAMIERTFDLVGEGFKILQGDNRYLIYKSHTVTSDEVPTVTITLDDPVPVANPDTGEYMLRVLRVRAGETKELDSSEYSYSESTNELTVSNVEENDVIRILYSASSYISGEEYFELNSTDPVVISADSVSIYLVSGEYIHRLQSVTIDVAFEREDQKEIGSSEVVLRGIKSQTVTVSLGRLLETWSIEEAMRDKPTGYGIIDVQQFKDNMGLVVKIYDNSLKQNFRYGIKVTGLSPTELRNGASVGNYTGADNTLEGSSLILTEDETVLGV